MTRAIRTINGERLCLDCRITKPIEEFYVYKKRNHAQSYCIPCSKLRHYNYQLGSKYGINRDTFTNVLAKQDGKCAICHEEFTKTPHIDHNHITGAARGLLCNRCNLGIGIFFEDVTILQSAIDYIQNRGDLSME